MRIEGSSPAIPEASQDFVANRERRELPFEGKVALITGANRGIGAEMAKVLAAQGATIISPHRQEQMQKRADRVGSEITAMGGVFEAPIVDITKTEDLVRMMEQLRDTNTHIDFLIHNAAGGLEEWATDDYAKEINAAAKRNLTIAIAKHNGEIAAQNGDTNQRGPLTVIDVPSLWSLHHPHGIKQLPDYEKVARTKYEGMELLKTAVSDLNMTGINDVRLLMLCGHGIGDTFTMQRFRKVAPEEIEAIEKTTTNGQFPTMKDMAEATARLLEGDYPSGHVEYVGIPNWNNEEVKKRLSMYGEEALYIDTIHFFGNQGFAEYRVAEHATRPYFNAEDKLIPIEQLTFAAVIAAEYGLLVTKDDMTGHFTEETEISVYPGHKQVATMLEATERTLREHASYELHPEIYRINNVTFLAPVVPGDRLYVTTSGGEEYQGMFGGTAEITREGKQVATIEKTEYNIEGEASNATESPMFTKDRMIEVAAQALGCLFMQNHAEGNELVPLFKGFESGVFQGLPIREGDKITITANLTEQTAKGFKGNAELYFGKDVVATFTGVSCNIAEKRKLEMLLKRLKRDKY